jgi:hypothetical protein
MSKHLEQDEIAASVAGLEIAGSAAEHLDSCVACRRQVQSVTDLIALGKEHACSGMPDWQEQRRQILARLPRRPPVVHARFGVRPMLAAAAALVLAIGLGVLRHGSIETQPPAMEKTVSVEQVLAEADALLADESIPGFELIDPGLEELLQNHGSNGAS